MVDDAGGGVEDVGCGFGGGEVVQEQLHLDSHTSRSKENRLADTRCL